MRTRIAINGFGRIGRTVARLLLDHPLMELVAVNDLSDNGTLAHLFKYDSIHGVFPGSVGSDESQLIVGAKKIRCYSEKDPSKLPWKEERIDVVLECTGRFTDRIGASAHLAAGAGRVILSAPAKGGESVKTIVLGVNESLLTKDDRIVSNASCTTNNAAPMLKVLDEVWGIESAFVTTVHAYTGDQNIHDAPHKDLRRARAAAVSIIPTTTGAAKALGDVLPHLQGKLGGAGVRVPTPDGSMTDITCILIKKADTSAVNAAFKNASETNLKGILGYTEDPIVSVDIIGSPDSCVFDAQLTTVLGSMVKVVGWYDNETGYSNRLVELASKMASFS
ncbi:MAG: type I glyceraldehyde-3-phosphate dehydrogenase [Bacteroidota bacterium]